MARPRKNSPIDLTQPVELTSGVIARLSCPFGKEQAFLRDSKAPGLRVRVTASGAKSYVFEAKLNRKTIRRTIGDTRAWTINQARAEANRLRVTLDNGLDPRELAREARLAREAQEAAEIAESVTVGEVWRIYIEARRSRWSDRHYRDHVTMVKVGGTPSKNNLSKLTQPGLLMPLMGLRLVDLTSEAIEEWAERESSTRPARVRLALRLLKAFTGWASEQLEWRDRVDVAAARSRKAREVAGKARPRRDHLQRDQLSAWFARVQEIPNPVVSAYLQCLLLTGARPAELASVAWSDVDFKWDGMVIRDKVEGSRKIPLTPYVSSLIEALPRRNHWVFSSTRSKSGHLEDPRQAHSDACQAAGVVVTLHGLRRSFKSLTEWLDVPVGIVAQIMGHKPSATAEKHYTIRPLDLLRVHHERIEEWILGQAGVLSFNNTR